MIPRFENSWCIF